jgi:FAD:protein FMN transferase
MQINRRRFITISAAASVTASAFAGVQAFAGSATAVPYRWQGTALGAKASLLLHHPDKKEAARIVTACVAEISRLENIFSLYREGSALVQLNKTGVLDHPPLELVQALADCRRISDISNGAFDVSVQPLWQLYAGHFSKTDPDLQGPSTEAIKTARDLVNYRNILISPDRIELTKPGMAITLNGFAQGFITDRVADLLRAEGLKNVLVDMGETRALDDHPDGRPWRMGIRDPKDTQGTVRTLQVTNQATATSGGYGQTFNANSSLHHLFNPKTGSASPLYASVTVIAPLAATADALSTALSSLPTVKVAGCLKQAGAEAAYILHHDGRFEDIRV